MRGWASEKKWRAKRPRSSKTRRKMHGDCPKPRKLSRVLTRFWAMQTERFLSSSDYLRLPTIFRSHRPSFGWIRFGIRFAAIRALRSSTRRSSREAAQFFRRSKKTQRLQDRGRVCGRRLAGHSGSLDFVSYFRSAPVGDEDFCHGGFLWFPD